MVRRVARQMGAFTMTKALTTRQEAAKLGGPTGALQEGSHLPARPGFEKRFSDPIELRLHMTRLAHASARSRAANARERQKRLERRRERPVSDRFVATLSSDPRTPSCPMS